MKIGKNGARGDDDDFVARNKVTKFLTITEQVSVLNFNASVRVHGTTRALLVWLGIDTNVPPTHRSISIATSEPKQK